MGAPKSNAFAFTAGHFELSLDNAKTSCYLKSIDGGFMSHSPISEQIGGEAKTIKHAAVKEIEPVSFEIGMAGSTSVLQWIQDSWNKKYQQRNGQVNHADFNMNTVFEHQFSDALITETTFPTLDGSSKDAAYLKVKFQPRAVATKMVSDGPKVVPLGDGKKQKNWLCNAFRLNIDGIDEAQFVNKIESFTIKQNVKKLQVGKHHVFELCPTKIEFPNLVCTISLAKAGSIHDWYQSYIANGKKDKAAQKSGSLEFLSPDRGKTLFRITMKHIAPFKFQILSSTANSDQIKRAKFELYVSDMELDGPGALGLE